MFTVPARVNVLDEAHCIRCGYSSSFLAFEPAVPHYRASLCAQYAYPICLVHPIFHCKVEYAICTWEMCHIHGFNRWSDISGIANHNEYRQLLCGKTPSFNHRCKPVFNVLHTVLFWHTYICQSHGLDIIVGHHVVACYTDIAVVGSGGSQISRKETDLSIFTTSWISFFSFSSVFTRCWGHTSGKCCTIQNAVQWLMMSN